METKITRQPQDYDLYFRAYRLVDADGQVIMDDVPMALGGVQGEICWEDYVFSQSADPMFEIVYINGPGIPFRPVSDFDL